MNVDTDKPVKTKPRRWFQFSLRTLFGVMLAAAILTGVAGVFRDSRHFALWSMHALIAALPILGVFVIHATAVVNGRRFAMLSLAIFGVALVTPALRLGGDLVFGYGAFFLSFCGIGLFSEWGASGEHFWYPICCTMGALANISFVVGYLSFLCYVIWKKGIRLARWSATLGSGLSLLVILPLEPNGVFIGYGLWVASLLSLAFGSWRTAIERRLEQPA